MGFQGDNDDIFLPKRIASHIIGYLHMWDEMLNAFKIPLVFLACFVSLFIIKDHKSPTLFQRLVAVIIRTITTYLPTWLLRIVVNSAATFEQVVYGLYQEKQQKRWVKKLETTNEQDGWEGYLIADDVENSEIGKDADSVILYAHGGGYVCGGALTTLVTFVDWIKGWKINHGVNTHILSLEYGLSPENSIPVARESMLLCYQWLVDVKGISPSKIIFVSALQLINQSYSYSIEKPPSALLLISPFLSAVTNTKSYRNNASYDTIDTTWLHSCVDAYLGDSNLLPTCPMISPLFENQLSELPRVWACVGGYEVFLDDITLFVEKLMVKEVKVEYVIEDTNFHDYAMSKLLSRDRAYENTIKSMGKFLFGESNIKKSIPKE
ncbi:7693_t:CDS:2 [Funneliformis mosseae]|uniref:7693_t:CDS:1 n=1 Tax=Funneliformis mosseae TaxID=27381 RepID=A0A9N9FA54_FUNMO|nr:7693_t:CDS:2 [Funneliformis mosseae]